MVTHAGIYYLREESERCLLLSKRCEDAEAAEKLRELGRQLATWALELETKGAISVTHQPPPGSTWAKGGLTKRQVERVTQFIEENLTQDISVDAFAGLLKLSRFHFVRAFKQSTGQSPYQYLLFRRAAHAKKMLTETQLPIAVIASASGFRSATQLNRTFRKIFGMSPSELRRKVGHQMSHLIVAGTLLSAL